MKYSERFRELLDVYAANKGQWKFTAVVVFYCKLTYRSIKEHQGIRFLLVINNNTFRCLIFFLSSIWLDEANVN